MSAIVSERYVVATATATAPTIVCPDWCRVDTTEHAADLKDWEGVVLHQSNDTTIGTAACVRHSRASCVTGRSTPPIRRWFASTRGKA